MSFGKLLSQSWKEYSSNFGEIFSFMFIFRVLPSLVFSLIAIFWATQNQIVYSYLTGSEITEFISPSYLVFVILYAVVSIALMFFVSGAFTSISLKKSKFRFNELKKEGKNVFWKYLSFSLVTMIFVMLLFLLLIVPGIIFAVYWIFGVYVFFDKKKGIKESLKESRKILKGNWWKAFGYGILFMLIYILVAIVFGLVSAPIDVWTALQNSADLTPNATLELISVFLRELGRLATELVMLPFGIFLVKNFYLSMKKK